MKIERALLSVSDKTGIVEFARGLREMGVEILSTGGTARALREAEIDVVDVSEFTGHPEMMEGRVKTLHPNVHGGILARRDRPEDMAELVEHGRGPIDLVAVNLYPFEETVAREDATFEECVEQIDIGGPCLIRASAKNHAHVLVVCRPETYPTILEAIRRDEVTDDLRKRLAFEAFTTTRLYDTAISRWFMGRKTAGRKTAGPVTATEGTDASGGPADLGLRRVGRLRHGDNPWQEAELFLTGGDQEPCAVRARGVTKAEPASLRELVDLDRALELAKQFTSPAAAAVREGAIVAAALGKSASAAIEMLVEAGFGPGCAIALNEAFDAGCAEALAAAGAAPISIIAPGFLGSAAEIVAKGREGAGPRLLEIERFEGRGRDVDHIDVCRVTGGLVLQERDLGLVGDEEPRVVSQRRPDDAENHDLLFAFACAKHGSSRSAAVAINGTLLGIGAGQPNTARSVDLALSDAGERAPGAVVAVDGPMGPDAADVIRRIGQAGALALMAPSGDSDAAAAAAADEAGVGLVLAGLSHLR